MPPRARAGDANGRGAAGGAAQAPEPAGESAVLRSLRDLAACSHELAAALTPRVRRVLLGLRTTLVALDELEVQPAWSYVWTQPRLRVQLFMALSFSTRRLAQAALLEDADDDETYAALFPCFLALGSAYQSMFGDLHRPRVPLEVRNGMVKLAMDSQFLQALTRLAAAVGEAEVREAQRRCAQLSSLRSARALRSATSDAKPLSTRLMIEGNCIGLLTTFVGVAMDLKGAHVRRVQDAMEASEALSCIAHVVVRMVAAYAELDAAKEAAATAVAVAGASASGSRAAAGSGGRGGTGGSASGSGAQQPPNQFPVRDTAAEHYNRVCKCAHVMWGTYVKFHSELAVADPAAAAAATKLHATLRWMERSLSRPCVQHLLLQHVLAQVVAVDAGSSYGLTPQQLLPAVKAPLVTARRRTGRRGTRRRAARSESGEGGLQQTACGPIRCSCRTL